MARTPMKLEWTAHAWIGGAVIAIFVGSLAGCSSIRPDFVYQSPFVRVYPVEDSAAVPPATSDRYLAKKQLDAVDLDTVNIDVYEQSDTLRPYLEMAILHLTVSEGMYAYDTDDRNEIANDLLRKAAAVVGSDAVVILRRETRREDETIANDDGPRDGRPKGATWPGDADRSREEWRDDWREARRYSVRAMALRWQQDR